LNTYKPWYAKEYFNIQLQPFDLLFVYGRTAIGRVISRVTRSPYSHVAVVLDRRHIAETDWRKPLRIEHNNYRETDYDVYRYHAGLTDEQKKVMEEFIDSMLGTKYDLLQTVTNGLFILTGFPIRDTPDRMNCSETVDRMFAAAGINLVSGAPGKVTPGELARSEKLMKVS
jgi:hypothetical protein